MLKEQF